MKKKLAKVSLIACGIIAVIVIGAIIVAITPEYVEVQISTTTGKCVKVLSEHGSYTCDTLPKVYAPIFVK